VATALTAARQQIGPALKVELDRLRLHLNAAGPLDQMDEFGSVGQLFENVMFRAFKLS